MDGTSYKFELISKQNRRSYQYHCPRTYAGYFKEVEEFQQAVTILKLLFEFSGAEKPEICFLPLPDEFQ